VYVNAGCYSKALVAADRWSSSAQDRGRASETVAHAYAQINRAEALHNLGKQSEALALLDEVEPSSQADPLSKNGLRLLRAWTLAHCARQEEAKLELALVEDAALRGNARPRSVNSPVDGTNLCGADDVVIGAAEAGVAVAGE
jgi:hypothetical protein